MQTETPQAQIRNGSFKSLWRRAPAFRGLVYIAAIASLAGAMTFSLDHSSPVTLESSSHETTKAVPQPSQPARPVANPEPLPEPQRLSRTSESAPLVVQEPIAESARQAAGSASKEDAQLARCHPHLIPASAAMPQIDVSRMADPSVGHIKVHFWVNGAGLVTREVLTGATYAMADERQAELDFTRALTFTVPNTVECRTREMELVGDYFEMKNASGQWATYVRLYPRLSFDADGVVRSRE